MPFQAACAIVGWLLAKPYTWTAVFLLLALFTYMRPGEIPNLSAASLFPPLVQAGLPYWTIQLASEESGKPTKTGQYDDALALGLPHHFVLYP